ncbi:MAG: AI-2E family transporter [Butyrivibrio sp.]|nr:AI-2E family transporter [Butyrivibrio sp.]
MKMRPEKNQVTWAITIFFLSIAIMLAYYVIFNGISVVKTVSKVVDSLSGIIIGVIIAFILIPLTDGIERKLVIPIYHLRGYDISRSSSANIKKRKQARKIAVTITMIVFLFVIYSLFRIIIPELISSIKQIVRKFPEYEKQINEESQLLFESNSIEVQNFINSQLDRSYVSLSEFLQEKLMPLVPSVDSFFKMASQGVFSIIKVLFDLVVGLIVAIYVLNSKEVFATKGKKIAYALFREEFANEVIGGFRFIGDIFEGFVGGKLVDSVIIGIICYIGCIILKLDYPLLISVIVGITNIIPFFGPYIGGGIGALLLMIKPVQALIFLIFIIVLQQFDGNILGPTILGSSTGLSSFWVLFSITFFGGIWGIVGWLVGVPIFAVIYAFISRITNILLSKKELSTETNDYDDLAYIENKEYKTLTDEHNDKFNAHKEVGLVTKLYHTCVDKTLNIVEKIRNKKKSDDK